MPLASKNEVGVEQLVSELPHMGIAELRRTCISNGISLQGCVEKAEVLQRIRQHFGIQNEKIGLSHDPMNQSDANETGQEQQQTDRPTGDATRIAQPMTTARLKALERKVGTGGVKPMRSQSSGLPTAMRDSSTFQDQLPLGKAEKTNIDGELKSSYNNRSFNEAVHPPVVLLSHGAMGNDVSDDSSDEEDSNAPLEAAGSNRPHFSATGLVSDDDASHADEVLSSADDDSEESNLDNGVEMTGGSGSIRILSTSESAFMQRMRMNSKTQEIPFVFAPR